MNGGNCWRFEATPFIKVLHIAGYMPCMHALAFAQ